MISISTDLFQTIVLALIFVILIALIALLAAVNGLKRSADSGSPRRAGTSAYDDTTSYPAYTAASAGDTGMGYTAQPAAQPAADTRPEVATSYVPLSQAVEPAAQPVSTSTAAPTLTGNEPEEQPFERDGRWWFKRGGDLLVYDEGTGQWVAAGVPSAAGASQSAGASSAATTGGYSAATTAGDVGEGWRCSSCGAINGSTATVCRMCFTPR